MQDRRDTQEMQDRMDMFDKQNSHDIEVSEASEALEALEALLQYAVHNGLMESLDVVQKRNELLHLLKIAPEQVDERLFNCPVKTDDARARSDTPTAILQALADDYAARGHFAEDTLDERDRFNAAVMGLCMPRMSEVMTLFLLHYMDSPVKATDYFYALCRTADYIQTERIKKDLYWQAETPYGTLEITVNLSKPEKDPRDIAAARSLPPSTYPRCLLCVENIGFAGNSAWPARQNLRAIALQLDGEPWYFQYSPYAYYNEHCIVLSEKHEPMHISERVFKRLIEFVNDFPHYFIGANADLPIVGGSILSHDHFQGGRHIFPMEKAKPYRFFAHAQYADIAISLVKWPLSVIRLTATHSEVDALCDETAAKDMAAAAATAAAAANTTNTADKANADNTDNTADTAATANAREARRIRMEGQMVALATHILHTWRAYTDLEADIHAFTEDVPHNTLTPIVRYNRAGRLEMDLVLRNNRTSPAHPLGIFHPHAEWHHVKKENIGLIEVMGLAVLPGRLKDELEAGNLTQDEIGHIFTQVLTDCGVFKDNKESRRQFMRFMETVLR